MTPTPTPTLDQPGALAAFVATLLEDAGDIDPNESLILYGLDSLAVMKTAAALKAQGVHVSFEELAQMPTLNAWAALAAARRVA